LEGNLGVPQKLAYKAFLDSVPVFRRCRARLRAHYLSPAPKAHLNTEDTLASSAVLLLVSPAHGSALNARRRLVQDGALEAERELRFVAALLTLREGAKQSGLWHHRRWLLRRVFPSPARPRNGEEDAGEAGWGGPRGDGEDALWGVGVSPEGFRTEFAVVQRACGVYPRNYHAWAHRYLCAEALAAALGGGGVADADGDMGIRAVFAEVWREERARVRAWIERHVADYSAVQYACRLDGLRVEFGLRLFPKLEGDLMVDVGTTVRPGEGEGEEEEEEESCAHAWALVNAYPAHESLWLYLRGALAQALGPFGGESQRRRDAEARHVLEEARAFAGDVLSGGKEGEGASVLGGERGLVRSHAVRFLGWLLWTEGRLVVDGPVVRRIAAAAGGERTSDLLAYLQAGPPK
ncbi:hypothetical protein C8Q78DRAFT_985847, partial [Trametes maxima]